MFKDLVRKNRSYRRFDESRKISREQLVDLVELARLVPSAANRQAIRYAISHESDVNAQIFQQLRWAAYLKDWDGPVEGERPTGYIILTQRAGLKVVSPYDVGIAAQTILLGATEAGLGGCILGGVNRNAVKEILKLADDVEILSVIALGYPAEEVVLEDLPAGGEDIKYYRDDASRHHVPKRALADILLNG